MRRNENSSMFVKEEKVTERRNEQKEQCDVNILSDINLKLIRTGNRSLSGGGKGSLKSCCRGRSCEVKSVSKGNRAQ
jgi:ABC-type iron transport system FetAB ATPase subunit